MRESAYSTETRNVQEWQRSSNNYGSAVQGQRSRQNLVASRLPPLAPSLQPRGSIVAPGVVLWPPLAPSLEPGGGTVGVSENDNSRRDEQGGDSGRGYLGGILLGRVDALEAVSPAYCHRSCILRCVTYQL